MELDTQKRKKLVEILIETDFLNISNDDSISWILESKKQGLRTAGLSIISLIAGCNEGIKYLTRDFYEFNVVDNISKVKYLT